MIFLKLNIRFLSLSLLMLIPAGLSHGGEPMSMLPGYITQSVIDGRALGGTQGIIAVNMAAGDANLQVNAAALAISHGRGIPATARVFGLQFTEAGQANSPDMAIARIGGNAFANASGLIAINQASGQGNAQANGIAIAMGINGKVVAESVLGAVTTGSGPIGLLAGYPAAIRETAVEKTAFIGARGIVQINQLAGSGNATANNIALRISPGGGGTSE